MTTIKSLGKNRIIMETVLYPKASVSAVVTAIDGQTERGYFMDTTRHSISLYAYGCRLLKKTFGLTTQNKSLD